MTATVLSTDNSNKRKSPNARTTENIGNKPKVTNSVIDVVIAIDAGSFLSRRGKT